MRGLLNEVVYTAANILYTKSTEIKDKGDTWENTDFVMVKDEDGGILSFNKRHIVKIEVTKEEVAIMSGDSDV